MRVLIFVIVVDMAMQGCAHLNQSHPTEISFAHSTVIEVVGRVAGTAGNIEPTLLVHDGELRLIPAKSLDLDDAAKSTKIPGYLVKTTWADGKVSYAPLEIEAR